MISWGDYARLEREDSERVSIKLAYVDMVDDLAAGVLLSQIVYWHLPSKSGESKLSVEHDGHLWIAKGRGDWYEETRLTARQVDRCLKLLVEKGLVVTKLYKFKGAPTTHVRLDIEKFLEVWASPNSPDSQMEIPTETITDEGDPFSPESRMEVTQSVNSLTTDTTADTTADTTKSIVSSTDQTPTLNDLLCPTKGYSEAFESFWGHFLAIGRGDSKIGTKRQWDTTLKSRSELPPHETAAQMIAAAENYAQLMRDEKRERRFIMQPAKFIGQDMHWQDYQERVQVAQEIPGVEAAPPDNWADRHTESPEARAVWDSVSASIASDLPEESFRAWFSDVIPIGLDGDQLSLAVPDSFTKGGIVRRFQSRIEELAEEFTGSAIRLDVRI